MSPLSHDGSPTKHGISLALQLEGQFPAAPPYLLLQIAVRELNPQGNHKERGKGLRGDDVRHEALVTAELPRQNIGRGWRRQYAEQQQSYRYRIRRFEKQSRQQAPARGPRQAC